MTRKSVKGSGREMSLTVDARIELIAAVECLSRGNPCPRQEPSAYLERIRESFDGGHPVLQRFTRMTPPDWRHKHPSLILLDFSQPPELEVAAHFDHYREQGQSDALSLLMSSLRDFASSDFMDFFKQEERFYESILTPVLRSFQAMDYLTPLEEYLGLDLPHRYHLIMAPLYHGSTEHNVLYRRANGIFDIYSISGHRGVSAGAPELEFDTQSFSYTAWHEVSHTVIDAITQEYATELLPLAPLYSLMTGLARSKYQGPGGWLHMVDEHIIRAITSRLDALTSGDAKGRHSLEKERNGGFALVGPVYKALLEYERSRDKFPTIRDFYPRIIRTLSGLYGGARPAAEGKHP